jgi:hypothetical protein
MATPPSPLALPLLFAPLTEAELATPASAASAFNNRMTPLINYLNNLAGAAGPTTLPSGVNVRGAQVTGLGAPSSPLSAISLVHAEANYSAQALAPQLEAGGKHGFKGYRALNSKSQQESYSTFLNRIANTVPTTSTSTIFATAPAGGNVTITIPAGYQLRMDGSIETYGTFTFTVALPSTQAITSVSRTAGIVTASGTFAGLSSGETVYVNGFSDASFDGNFELTSVSGSSLMWVQPNFANATSGSGTVSTGGCYYAYLKNPSQTLDVAGPYPQDSQLNRLQSNVDNQVLICVAVVNSSGLVSTQSAGGATVPIATNNGNHILGRL